MVSKGWKTGREGCHTIHKSYEHGERTGLKEFWHVKCTATAADALCIDKRRELFDCGPKTVDWDQTRVAIARDPDHLDQRPTVVETLDDKDQVTRHDRQFVGHVRDE